MGMTEHEKTKVVVTHDGLLHGDKIHRKGEVIEVHKDRVPGMVRNGQVSLPGQETRPPGPMDDAKGHGSPVAQKEAKK